MVKLLAEYGASAKTLEDIIDFHVKFERIHPFQDGNGHVGRLVMLKDTCGTGQDVFKLGLKNFGYGYLIKEGEL